MNEKNTMSDDSFIREVDEELRSDRVQEFWTKYGKLLIAGAVGIVLVTGGTKFYQYYTQQQAASAGDSFMEAVRLADGGKADEAISKLRELQEAGSPTYAALARMRAAAELAKKGELDSALSEYDAISATGSVDANLRDIARLRAGLILVDTGTAADVENRVGPLMAPGAPYRGSAREALALARFKAGDLESAHKLLTEIRSDEGTPRALGQRAQLMLELIAAKGGPKAGS